MRIFKLKYESKEQAAIDLLEKGITYNIEMDFGQPTQALVDLEDGRYDLMIDDTMLEVDFGVYEVFPANPIHTFEGWGETQEEIPTE